MLEVLVAVAFDCLDDVSKIVDVLPTDMSPVGVAGQGADEVKLEMKILKTCLK